MRTDIARDELTASSMRRDLLALVKRLGLTVLFVTHNAFEAAAIFERRRDIVRRLGLEPGGVPAAFLEST